MAGPEEAGAHAIFLHGLRGSIEGTWGRAAEGKFWPGWLSGDIPALAVWAVQYAAPASKWRRQPSMALPETATAILQRITYEPQLRSGNIALVGYSLGGVLAKAVLRRAGDAKSDLLAGSFLNRVDRVATIASPHSGSLWASLQDRLSFVSRPSELAKSLRSGDPWLHELNQWFLEWHAGRPECVLAVVEGHGKPFAGKIVSPESANPGLRRELIVAANHETIVKVASPEDQVYRVVLEYLRGLPVSPLRVPATTVAAQRRGDDSVFGSLAEQGASDRDSLQHGLAQLTATVQGLQAQVGALTSAGALLPDSAADAEISSALDRLRRGRFIPSFPREEQAKLLSQRIRLGDLRRGTAAVRRDALAWCARILAQQETQADATEALRAAELLGSSEVVVIAGAFIEGLSDRVAGLRLLEPLAGPLAASARLFMVGRQAPPSAGLTWFESSDLSAGDLDDEGTLLLLTLLLQERRWSEAYEIATTKAELGSETPNFHHLAALTRVAMVLPEEIRELLAHVPIHPRTLPLAADEAGMANRRNAISLFRTYAAEAIALGCTQPAQLAEDMALWLRLRDPISSNEALEELRRSRDDPSLALRRLTLLLDYGLDLDLPAVERQIEVEGEFSPEAATARFALTFTQDTPSAAAAYLRQHREQLERHLAPGALAITEIELLARAGQLSEARERLAGVPSDQLDERMREQADAIIRGAEAGREALEEADEGVELPLPGLMALVEKKAGEGDWASVRVYAGRLFERTLDADALLMLVRALNALSDFTGIYQLLRDHGHLRELSRELQMQWAWALFRHGDFVGASRQLELFEEDDPNRLALRANISMASGRWHDLFTVVERVFETRESQPIERLLSTARLASAISSNRAEALVRAAVARAPNDASALVTGYTIATEGGWEGSDEVAGWLIKAAELSGDDGPVQSVSVESLLERQPGWQELQQQVADKLRTGELPMFGAARLLNDSLLRMVLSAALANSDEPDPRRRKIIPVRRGRAKTAPETLRRAVLDVTTLLVLAYAGVLEAVITTLEEIVIPHDTLTWLFAERRRLPFHQPSRLTAARHVRDAVAAGRLLVASGSSVPSDQLVREVGRELAELLSEAQRADTPEQPHRVVRARPIFRPGSLSREEAELGSYADLLRSCTEVLNAVVATGVLTREEESEAREFLSRQEVGEDGSEPVSPGAVLYLDSLTLGYMYQCGILDRLPRAGFTVWTSTAAIAEYDQLLAFEGQASEVDRLVEGLRATLENALSAGKVVLGPNFKLADSDDQLASHPSLDVFELAARADALIVDDRALGRYDNVQTTEGLVPVLSSYELLGWVTERGGMSEDARLSALARLRRANMAFIPVERAEVEAQLSRATVTAEGGMVEPLELRALRENVVSLRGSEFLQLPDEAAWLTEFLGTLRPLASEQWRAEIPDSLAAARTDWLIRLSDIRTWSHRLPGTPEGEALDSLYVRSLLTSILAFDGEPHERERYRAWVSENLLPWLEQQSPRLYRSLLDEAWKFVQEAAERMSGADAR